MWLERSERQKGLQKAILLQGWDSQEWAPQGPQIIGVMASGVLHQKHLS